MDRGEDEQKVSLLAQIPIITPPVGESNSLESEAGKSCLPVFFDEQREHLGFSTIPTTKLQNKVNRSCVQTSSCYDDDVLYILGVCVIYLAQTEAPYTECCLVVWGLHLR